MDPLVAASIAAPASVIVVKAIDWLIGRSQQSQSERDELRKDVKLAREDAEHERARRRLAEADLDAEQAKSRALRAQLDDAEEKARESRALHSKINKMKSERELARTRHRQDLKTLQDRIAELRQEVRRLGGSTGPLRR